MYQMPIYRRSRGCGCSVCNGKKIVSGNNDLATRAPHLAKEWDYDGNKGVTPDQVALYSNSKYAWICDMCGHKWKATPSNRAAGRGCPKCAGCCVDPDLNSIEAVNPYLAEQWDAQRNHPLTARDVAAYDNRDYFWICDSGHSWEASPANRNKGTGCPYCNGKLPVVGVNDFATICPSIAMEWHPTKNVGLHPQDYLPNSHEEVWWKCKEDHEWQQMIYERVNGSMCPYCSGRKAIPGELDLATKCKYLLPHWDYTKNQKSPEEYFPDSSTRVSWKCEEGHRFRAPIREMALRWRCPKCERKRNAPWRK